VTEAHIVLVKVPLPPQHLTASKRRNDEVGMRTEEEVAQKITNQHADQFKEGKKVTQSDGREIASVLCCLRREEKVPLLFLKHETGGKVDEKRN
jgi:hypothetical protein